MNTVYILADPRWPQKVRYVGITKQPLSQRSSCHICTARKGGSWPVSRWLRKLEKAGLRPDMRAIEETPDRLREKYWIAHYLAQGANLLNCAEATGAEVIWSAEMRAKIGAAHRGTKRSPETCARMSESRKQHDALYGHKGHPPAGVPSSEETKRKRAASGYRHSAETRARISAVQMGRKPPPRPRAKSCRQGHLYTADTLRVTPDGRQRCRVCIAAWAREKHRRENPACIPRKTKRQQPDPPSL